MTLCPQKTQTTMSNTPQSGVSCRVAAFAALGLAALTLALPGKSAEAQIIDCPTGRITLNVTNQQMSLIRPTVGRVSNLEGYVTTDGNVTVWRERQAAAGDVVGVFVAQQCDLGITQGDYLGIIALPQGRVMQSCCTVRAAASTTAAAPAAENEPQRGTVIGNNDRRVNVRAEPNTGADNIVGVVRGGQELTIAGDGTGADNQLWYSIQAGGNVSGWIRGDFVELIEQAEQTVAAATPTRDPSLNFGWAENILTYMRPIDGCLNHATAKPAQIEFVLPRRSDVVDVRLKDASNRRWRCIVGNNGGTPSRFDPLVLEIRPDNQPTFVRSPAVPRSNACSRIEPVMDDSTGGRLGWLVFDICG